MRGIQADSGPGPGAHGPTVTSRGRVLDAVRSHGPISRVELAERTGLTQASISHLVRRLLNDNLLVETGKKEYTGGQPRVMLTLNPNARCSVGVQLGADWIALVLTDANGAVIARTRLHGARSTEPDAVVRHLAAEVESLLRICGIERAAVTGVGVAAPGVLDLETGAILTSPSLRAWEGYPLRESFEEAADLPITLDNEATAAAIGEFWRGGILDSHAHCTLYMGATVSAGILIAGSAYRGASSNTGPLGRVRLSQADGSPGARVEDVAGPVAVAAEARYAIAAGRESSVQLTSGGDPFADFAAVATAAVHGDPLCTELVERSAHRLADAAMVVVDLLDLDSMVLAGPAFTTAGTLYLPVIRRRIAEEAFAAGLHGVRVDLSRHVSEAAALGAAAVVLQQTLSPRQLGAG